MSSSAQATSDDTVLRQRPVSTTADRELSLLNCTIITIHLCSGPERPRVSTLDVPETGTAGDPTSDDPGVERE